MADCPILFSAPMVRALLAGTKTQTRRPFKGIEDAGNGVFHINTPGGGLCGLSEESVPKWAPEYLRIAVGDRLWVREAWRSAAPLDDTPPRDLDDLLAVPTRYEADGECINWREWDGHDAGRLRASMHLPRWASRLTLIVTDVRVQRLQDISEEDARAEGCDQALADAIMEPEELAVFAATHILAPRARARIIFETLWEQINGAGSWAANPWVAAYSFEVHHQNIDALPLPAARDAAMKEGGN